MNNIIINDKRKIEDISRKILNNNKTILHPIYLKNIKDNTPLGEAIKIGNTWSYKNKKLDNINNMAYVRIPLHSNLILLGFSVETIDDLIKFVDDNIEKNNPEKFITRIINTWIFENINQVKNYNKIIYSLFDKINKKYKILDPEKNISSDKIKSYIDKWINTKDINDFHFDLFEDIYSSLGSS